FLKSFSNPITFHPPGKSGLKIALLKTKSAPTLQHKDINKRPKKTKSQSYILNNYGTVANSRW
ncbi:hypothetical protein ACRW2H_23915, partial [Escherichia coli]|uniref:hypothetical protein n=1 Tax=Escherichia coli TaxID=562 RepID=UPI0030798D17